MLNKLPKEEIMVIECTTFHFFQLVRELGTGLELDILECMWSRPEEPKHTVDGIQSHFRNRPHLGNVPTKQAIEDALGRLIGKKWVEYSREWEDFYRIPNLAEASIASLNDAARISAFVRDPSKA